MKINLLSLVDYPYNKSKSYLGNIMLVVPHLILQENTKILLLRRASTQKLWARHWHCVTGTIEEGESPEEALIRETYEEIGLKLTRPLQFVTAIFLTEKDLLQPGKVFHAVELFFLSTLPEEQIPINKEPRKHDALEWFSSNDLPEPMIPGVKFGIECYLREQNYGELRSA